jgi:HEAT repeat protein
MWRGLFACLFAGVTLTAGHTQPSLPGNDADSLLTPVTREWQTAAVARLKAFRPTVTTPIVYIEDQGQGRLTITRGPGGILWLGREDWVYLTSYWSHDANPQVVLVIDRKGRIYRNFEHICPSLFLQNPENAELDSLDAFLKTQTDPGDGPPEWQLIDDSAATPDREALPTALEHEMQVAVSEEASAEARRLAVRALIRQGSEEAWEVARGVIEGSEDWPLLDEARRATAGDAARAGVVRRILDDSLGADPAERAEHLAEAILAAEDRDTLDYLLTLSEGANKTALCAAFDHVARTQDQQVFWQIGPFRALRNSITAFIVVDPQRAVACYRGLLDSPSKYERQAGIYGVGELRLADTVEKLMALVERDTENSLYPSAVCVALGKIGTPEAYDALIRLLLQEPIHVKQSWSVLVVMTEVCGRPGGSPRGDWWNGFWATVAEDQPAVAQRFSQAMNRLADMTTDERLAREARGRASSILSQAR